MTRSTLEELLARCERAMGSDRKLDAEIYCAANPTWRPDENISGQVLGIEFRSLKGAPLLTCSIDAIVGLISTDLGWYWRAGYGSVGEWVGGRLLPGWCHLNRVHPDSCEKEDESTGYGATVPLACCSAFLRAKLSSPGGDE